jgi:hypothetical protein
VYNVDSDGVTRHRGGFGCQDVSGSMTELAIRGMFFALYFNGIVALDIDRIDIDSAPGTGGNVSRIYWFGGFVDSLPPHIHRLNLLGSSLLLKGTGWDANPDWHFLIDELKLGTANGRDVVWAYAASSLSDWEDPTNVGNGAVLTGSGAAAGEVRLAAPSASDTGRAVLVMQGAPFAGGTGMIPVSLSGGTCVVNSAVNPGDILKFSGTTQFLAVDNSAVAPVAKFRAKRKTANAGLAECTPF